MSYPDSSNETTMPKDSSAEASSQEMHADTQGSPPDRLLFDFDRAEVHRLFPAHGWSKNSQGVRLLWLPIRRLLQNANEVRAERGITTPLTESQFAAIRRFHDTCEKLVRTLQKLAGAKRASLLANWESLDENEEDFNKALSASKELPLWLDLAYVYLRRIADDFARASRYVLFRKWGSAPEKFELLQSKLRNPAELANLHPLYETNMVESALTNANALGTLITDSTDPDGQIRKAVRNRLEHHPVVPHIQGTRTGDGPFVTEAFLLPRTKAGGMQDLIGPLPEALSDLSRIFTVVCTAVGYGSDYGQWISPFGDCAFEDGSSSDLTEFWPPLMA